MSTRKQEWLGGALAYLVEHGVASLSLRPMAAALGISLKALDYFVSMASKQIHAPVASSLA